MNQARSTQNRSFSVAAAAFVLLLGLSVALGGCQLAALPWLMWGQEPTRKVPADYPYMADKRVAIFVWAETDTLYEYPYVQLDVSEWVRSTLESKVAGVVVVPNRQIVDFQQRNRDWDRTDPAELGERFGAERVMWIELTQYGTREPDSPHLYRGRMSANIKVYDSAYPSSKPVYKTSIETAYPRDSVGQWGTDDTSIRKATLAAFAEDVAAKFHDHLVKVK